MLTRLFHKIWRNTVFWFGDVRRISHFPYVTWAKEEHLIDYSEALEALKYVKSGCIGLHRDRWVASNLAIPGFMKHAWMHVNGPNIYKDKRNNLIYDTTGCEIVEAVSEGVLRRSAMWPIMSSYVIILEPIDVSLTDTNDAINKANKIVGCEYDYRFNFDIENELKLFKTRSMKLRKIEKEELLRIQDGLRSWDGGFCCTEVVAYSWWHRRNELRLFRKKQRGKLVITADDMINHGFKIVWMSKSVTPEIAKEMGLGEEGLEMINEYIKNKR